MSPFDPRFNASLASTHVDLPRRPFYGRKQPFDTIFSLFSCTHARVEHKPASGPFDGERREHRHVLHVADPPGFLVAEVSIDTW